MIINHDKKYIFVGLPFSASSAISKELLERYDGEFILNKHANIPSFVRQMPKIDIAQYCIFAVVRDPVDIAWTKYNKILSNAYGAHTNPDHFIENGGWVTKRARRIYKKVTEDNLSFEEYLCYIHRLYPFDNDLSINAKYLDRIIRFEHLLDDFRDILLYLGIKPVRDLPIYNKTEKIVQNKELSDGAIRKIFGAHYRYNKKFYSRHYKINVFEKVYFSALQSLRFIKRLRFDVFRSKQEIDFLMEPHNYNIKELSPHLIKKIR